MATIAGQLGQGFLSSAASSFGSSSGSGLGDALFGGIKAKRQWKYQQKAMKLQQRYALEQMAKSAEYQLSHDKEMFDYENAYNDPSKVFERYLKAGVTPAAVLGSSGVGVNATVSTGSGGAPSGGSPSGGAPNAGGVTPMPSDPLMIAQMGVARSTEDRNDAAAQRDRAEADDIRTKMQTPEYYKSVADLNVSIQRAGVSNANAVADMNRALADIYQADASYADLSATYKFQDLVAQYAKHREEYENLRKYNVEYMDKVYAAQLALDYARAYEASASGDLAKADKEILGVKLQDLQNWFNLNWTTEIAVPQVTESGKPTGKTVKMTGEQIHKYLIGLDVSTGNQEMAGNWFRNRSEKNAFGYSLARTALQGAISVGTAYAGGKALAAPQTSVMEEMRENYDRNGEYIGGTRIRREDLRSRSRK
ncbi:DNA pilot protein [Dipodfec virus UA23Rod_963]|uniref:DNA pilot protein n=1 Tax=Dipodfec virus UA23Rod_963 TaxID=2929335 RepID=A0A976N2V7_9VIRU|nr:DNA pilot protein [Dipodfec virus UA23Rod_963]